MVGLSTKKSPLAGMGFAQKIATVVLGVLALVALIAVLAHGGGSSTSSGGRSSSGASATEPSHQGARSGTGASDGSATPRQSGTKRTSTAGKGSADGLATVAVDQLPPQASTTLTLIDAGGPFPYSRDGVVFSNREGVLPRHPRGWYHEYTVKTPGESDRGARRLIAGKDGTIFYTDDHYVTFRRVMR